jgi:predicted O-methyltransferase YrrM
LARGDDETEAMSGLAATLERAGRGIDRYGARGFATRATLRGLRPVLAPLAARRLRAAGQNASDLEALVDVPFSLAPFGVELPCGQVRAEVLGLLEAVAAERPRRLLEIGTAGGGTLFLLALAADRAATIVSVDLPEGEFGGGYPVWKIPLYRGFVRRTQRLHLIRGDSHAPETLARTRTALRGEPLDFLLIDGDHTYDGARRDFSDYGPLVRPGGLIAFHDIAQPGELRPGGALLLGGEVPRLWRELRDRYETRELLASPDGFFGIGLLRVPPTGL